nr:unnamed protein product [Callosobruchus analis]
MECHKVCTFDIVLLQLVRNVTFGYKLQRLFLSADVEQGNTVEELFLLIAPIYLANGKLHQLPFPVKLPIRPGREKVSLEK